MIYCDGEKAKVTTLPNGITRKVMAYGDDVMTTFWTLPVGVEIQPHQHPHLQISIILEGVAEFTIGDEVYVCKAGDSIVAPSNVPHCVKILEPLKSIDVFKPLREDLLGEVRG